MTSATPIFYPEDDGKPIAESDITRNYLSYAVTALGYYFCHRDNVYVSANLFVYYEEGVPETVVAPDVFVVCGVSNHQRRNYKVWEENNKTPGWVLEITSESTRKTDTEEKPLIYAEMGVREYFLYDPCGDYLEPHLLQGFRLVNGQYEPRSLEFMEDGVVSIYSYLLGLELRVISGELRFYDPVGQKLLLSYSQMLKLLSSRERV